MAEHSYDDAPLWTVLSTLAMMEGSEARVIDLARKVKTASGWPGAYRAIGRLVSAGYAILDDVAGDDVASPSGHRATVRLTSTGTKRWRMGAGYVQVLKPVRTNTTGGFGVVYRAWWTLRPRKTP